MCEKLGSEVVVDDLYRYKTGNRVIVGGVTTKFRSVYRVEGLQGG